jgi:uncharacterized membrane protein YgcG
LCGAQFDQIWETALVKDKLLTLMVMVGAVVAYWVVMFQQYRKKPRHGSRHYDSAGGGDAGGEGGSHGSFDGHGLSRGSRRRRCGRW